MYLFSKRIKCLDCGSNFTGKKARGKSTYICGGYHNNKSNCKRFLVREDELVEVVNKHFDIKFINNQIVTEDRVGMVKSIEVKNEQGSYTINYNGNDYSSIIKSDHIKY